MLLLELQEGAAQLLTPAPSAVELPLGGTEQSVCDSVRLSVWAQGVHTHARTYVCVCVCLKQWGYLKRKKAEQMCIRRLYIVRCDKNRRRPHIHVCACACVCACQWRMCFKELCPSVVWLLQGGPWMNEPLGNYAQINRE